MLFTSTLIPSYVYTYIKIDFLKKLIIGEENLLRLKKFENIKDLIEFIRPYYPEVNIKEYKIVVSPIGGQGFIFGRGNKQFTPNILRIIGIKNIIIISTANKARELKNLHVDTGEKQIDEMLSGLVKVIIGYKEERIMRIVN